MQDTSPRTHTEKQRLAALLNLKILDTPFETVFDRITKVASEVCGTPIALISLIDEKRQWFKANVGLDGICETPRGISFCTYTIDADDILEVPDATQDERFCENPLVTSEPAIKFYCGAVIKMPMGENIGSLCVIDTEVRYMSETQRIALRGLATIIADLLVAREVNIRSRSKENA